MDKIKKQIGALIFYSSLAYCYYEFSFKLALVIFLCVWGNNVAFNIKRIDS
jgi:hypothetical protein